VPAHAHGSSRRALVFVLGTALGAAVARHAAAAEGSAPETFPEATTAAVPAAGQRATPPELATPSGLPPIEWRWRRFSTLDYAVSLAGGAVTLAAAVIPPRPVHALDGPVLFDAGVRDALRASSLQSRYTYRDFSDVGVSLAITWPFFADALTTAWWYRGSRDAAEQIALIDLEALAVIGALQGATNVIASRQRPYGPDCGKGDLPANAQDCAGSTRYRSFFSGHTAFSFTGAALICMHHFKHDLLGAPWDALSCAGGYAVAAATGTFRVVADMHYATDVMTGLLAGTLVGYGVPLLHYAFPTTEGGQQGLSWTLVPAPGGASILGVF
jgi:membrane-associated phospholipid phosphatase